MADELRQKGLDHDAEIGDRARKLVLDKLQIAQWAELTKHRMLQEAEVEALQIRIEMERLEQTADKDELVARTGQRLNRVFLEGKAEELGLQEGVAEVARRSAISALKHDIDVEVRSLELDRAKGERSDEELARALKHKVLVADFTREQTVKDAETAGEVRRQAIALRGDDWRDKHAEQRGLIDIAAYERERQIELEKKEDDNDLDTLAKLQKIKAEKEARRAEAKLKADREAAALKAAADKQAHTEKMEQAQVAGAPVRSQGDDGGPALRVPEPGRGEALLQEPREGRGCAGEALG